MSQLSLANVCYELRSLNNTKLDPVLTYSLSYIQWNMSPRFEWQSVISQSACTDETHNSFDQEFHLTVHNHFLSSILAYQRGQLHCTWGREKNIPVSYFCGRSIACHGNTLIQLGQSLFQAILSYIQERKKEKKKNNLHVLQWLNLS